MSKYEFLDLWHTGPTSASSVAFLAVVEPIKTGFTWQISIAHLAYTVIYTTWGSDFRPTCRHPIWLRKL